MRRLHYFSYGSNMFSSRLRGRGIKSATAKGAAVLHGHELKWDKRSNDESGKCHIICVAGSEVHGVLFEIDEEEKPLLDKAEGLGKGYNERQVQVEGGFGSIEAWTYYATNVGSGLVPYTWYKAYVLAGAKEHGLPNWYIRKLESVVAIEDPKRERHRKESEALLK